MKESRFGPFKALVFDQDGTILDAETLHCASWCHVSKIVSVTFNEEIFATFAGKGDLAIAEYVANKRNNANANELIELKRAYYRDHLDDLKLMPGVLSFLQQAKEAGFIMAMATISPEEETDRTIGNHQLDRYFTCVVHRESKMPRHLGKVVQAKPAPDIYLAAAMLLDVEPNQCCAFEDSLTGLNAAKKAGMRVVVVPTEYSQHFDFSQADVVAESFKHITVDHYGMIMVRKMSGGKRV